MHTELKTMIDADKWNSIYMWARYCGFNMPTFIRRTMMFKYPGTANEVFGKFYEISEEEFYFAAFEFAKFHLKHTPHASPITP